MPQHGNDPKYDLTAVFKETLHKQILELLACGAAATAKVGYVEGKPSLVGRQGKVKYITSIHTQQHARTVHVPAQIAMEKQSKARDRRLPSLD